MALPFCLALSIVGQSPALGATPSDALLMGQVAEPQSLDPQVATAANDARILVNIYDGLGRNGADSLETEPAPESGRGGGRDRGERAGGAGE